MKRPDWCKDEECQPLFSVKTKGGGSCIGKLSAPITHITKDANDLCWCHYDGYLVTDFAENQYDLIVAVYMVGEVFRKLELSLPRAIVNNLPKREYVKGYS